ncbi:MAG: adenylate/guanylate cyclase domain-containing protein, partial [Elusimicrobia bacterium]|nr:adenylate/guanylate cyclase domain-containing protein [Elusimicrobiota bacterium]
DELLELMAQAKKQLESQKKSLSFLAIDVVNSTGMKVGEDPAIATRDFKLYRKLVEKAIADNNGLKAAWTPDGVMICFPTAAAAVSAAKQVIKDLEHFNAHVKAMHHPFKVRCGINTGTVLFDDTVPMEEMSDRSIDIAGHMQKYADANAIFIGKHVIEEMRTATDFQPASREVDGCEVYAWRAEAN